MDHVLHEGEASIDGRQVHLGLGVANHLAFRAAIHQFAVPRMQLPTLMRRLTGLDADHSLANRQLKRPIDDVEQATPADYERAYVPIAVTPDSTSIV